MINGESFLVEANRQVKLQSKDKPGVTYEVAIRVAPRQRMTLNTFQFQYDRRSKVDDNHQPKRRTVRLQHQLGFTMLITDLGGPLGEQSRDKALTLLTQPVLESLRDRGIKQEDIAVGRLEPHQFGGAEGRGVRIRYRDGEAIEHSILVYIMVGKTFTGSCIVQFLDADSDNVLPLVKETFDSIRAVEGAGSPNAKPMPHGK